MDDVQMNILYTNWIIIDVNQRQNVPLTKVPTVASNSEYIYTWITEKNFAEILSENGYAGSNDSTITINDTSMTYQELENDINRILNTNRIQIDKPDKTQVVADGIIRFISPAQLNKDTYSSIQLRHFTLVVNK